MQGEVGVESMDIVVVEAFTTNPGDVSWDALEALGDVTYYERTAARELAERVAWADVVVSNKTVWDTAALDAAPNLKMLALLSTGYNTVDLEACRARGIAVANVPAYSTPDVAQMTFALLLELTMRAGRHSAGVLEGRWTQSPDFCYWDAPLVELAGKTMGIVGFGSIGSSVARIARAFGMEVVFANRSPKPEMECEGVRQASLDELLACADVVTLHVPATPETVGFIDAAALGKMKQGAYLVNTARGNIIDEAAVATALKSGRLAGFAADVMAVEPMRADNPLLCVAQESKQAGEQLNIVITPHIAWAVREARERLIGEVAANIKAFAAGCPRNIVS